MVAETVFAPKFLSWEVAEAKKSMAIEIEQFAANPQALVQELAHPAAYGGASPLGRPLMCPAKSVGQQTPEVLSSYVAEHFTPEKMVVTAAGYDHKELVALATEMFGGVLAGSAPAAKPSPYVGGETRVSSDDDLTHFA